jgi:hypothetical protein
VLRRIFGPKGEEIPEGRRKEYIEELRNLYPSPKSTKVTVWLRMDGGGK